MPRGKKKFIDKKHAITFSLVNRSQRDPEAANDEAPQRNSQKEEQLKYGIYFDDDYNYLKHLKDVDEFYQVQPDSFRVGKRSSDMLKEVPIEEKPRLLLPSSVFASNGETVVGLLNMAAPVSGPHPDLDPDILAALDGEVDPHDEMDDDFIVKANDGEKMDEGEFDDDEDDDDEDDDDDTLKSENNNDEDDDETQRKETKDHKISKQMVDNLSRYFKTLPDYDKNVYEGSDDGDYFDGGGGDAFDVDIKQRTGRKKCSNNKDDDSDEVVSRVTGSSMTSSVIRRNENLRFIDAKFEKFYKDFKNDDDDDDDVELVEAHNNQLKSDVFQQLSNQFQDMSRYKEIKMKDFEPSHDKSHILPYLSTKSPHKTDMEVPSKVDDDEDNDDDENEDDDKNDVEDDDEEDEDDDLEERTIVSNRYSSIAGSSCSSYRNQPKTITLQMVSDMIRKKRDKRPTRIATATNTSSSTSSSSVNKKDTGDDDDEMPLDPDRNKLLVLERSKDETTRERKARKQAIKDNRRIRRAAKRAAKKSGK
ncbi:hypothetical protein HELRODRAFT_173738 [Helobdella robusta]|uniref:Protein LTV1 homolog n=1 Tax=Helobdella robusta TaxID=6412 RepID=T1F765_HELRO|nr:hypothetical protein HELRODRAFT_173738 [Helobdella robusta]ESO03443.1 hypothetical protein HELRODRAFT_173738 [Helobdella robusta]